MSQHPPAGHHHAAPVFSSMTLAALIVSSGLAPLGTASYLPALPVVASDLGVSPSEIQLTLTSFIIGMALGQLVIGPLSDRIGRRPPLLAGILLFGLVSLVSASATSLEWLILLRALQGFTAASGMVLGRAIVADRAWGDDAARLMSLMMGVGMLVPALSPLFGAGILLFGTWRTVFVGLAVVAVLLAVLVFAFVPETLAHKQKATDAVAHESPPRPTVPSTERRGVLPFSLYCLAIGLSFAAMYAYISSGPFVFQTIHGFSELEYAVTTAGISLLMGAVALTVRRSVGGNSPFGVLTPGRVAGLALVVFLIGAVSVGVASAIQPPAWVWIIAFAILSAPLALFAGLATAVAMSASPWRSGLSSAILGVTQAGIGAASPPLAGIGGGSSTTAMAIVMLVAATAAVVAFLLARRLSRLPGHDLD